VENKIIHIAFALIFLINFTSVANAGKEIEIVNASTPAIYGDNLVYVRSKSVDGQYAYYQHISITVCTYTTLAPVKKFS